MTFNPIWLRPTVMLGLDFLWSVSLSASATFDWMVRIDGNKPNLLCGVSITLDFLTAGLL